VQFGSIESSTALGGPNIGLKASQSAFAVSVFDLYDVETKPDLIKVEITSRSSYL